MAAAVNGRALGWALAFAAASLAILGGVLPGSSGWALGPRLGIGLLLASAALLLLVGSLSSAIRGRTARIEGAGGNCPVGATCACGHFNFKPRKACRQCGAPTSYTA